MAAHQLLNIIILNWNGSEDTIECIDSLLLSSFNEYRIIVIDNGSTDNSIENITNHISLLDSSKSDIITIISSTENLGFAKGCNLGMNYCREHNLGSLVLLLNNDTEVCPDSIEKLLDFHSNHPEYCALSPQIRLFYDKQRIWNCGGRLSFGNRKYYYANQLSSSLPNKAFIEASFLTGCALLFDFERTGVLTERFFYGEEDFEFALRLQSKGMKMACVLNSIIYHKVGRSINKNKGRNNALALSHIHYLNRIVDYREYCKSGVWFNMWLGKNLAELYFYLRKSEKLSHSQRVKVIQEIISDSQRYNGVNRELFSSIIGKYQSTNI